MVCLQDNINKLSSYTNMYYLTQVVLTPSKINTMSKMHT